MNGTGGQAEGRGRRGAGWARVLATLVAGGLIAGEVVGTAAPAAAAATAAGALTPGTVFVAEYGASQVVEVPPGGGAQATVGTDLSFPFGVAVDAAGDVFIADTDNSRVVEVPADGGPQTTVGTGLNYPEGVAVDAAGDVFIADTFNGRVVEVPAGGGPETIVATGLDNPTGVAVDAAGDVFVADFDNVMEIPAGGGAPTTVGTGLYVPEGVAVDTARDVFIADTGNNRVVEVPPGGGAQITVAAGLNDPRGVALDAAGDVFIVDKGDSQVFEVPAGGGAPTPVITGLSGPYGGPTGVAVYAPAPTFGAETPPAAATVGTAYPAYTYTAVTPAGEPAARFAVASGALPPGLSLHPSTGVLSGTPTTPGSYQFVVETENAANATLGPPTTITVAPATKSSADLAVTITAPAKPGPRSFTASITVTDNRPSTATAIATGLTVSSGLTVTAAPGGAITLHGRAAGYYAASLAPGRSITYVATITPNHGAHGAQQLAAGTASTKIPDPYLHNNAATTTVTLP